MIAKSLKITFIRCVVPPKKSISSVMKALKGASARDWFKQFPDTKKELWKGSLWSHSYFASTIGDVSKEVVMQYVQDQLKEFNSGRSSAIHPLVETRSFLANAPYKKAGLKRLLKKISHWRLHPKFYFTALFLPLLILFIVWMIGLILRIPSDDFFNSGLSVYLLLLFFLYQIFTSGLEEPGWRGFALEHLEKAYSFETTNWILGTIWAVWHFPYVIYLYYGDGVTAILFTLLGFSFSIIGQTFIFSWLYLKTRSVFLMILFHAWLNTSTTLVLGDITIENPVMGTVPALVTWGIVFLLTKYAPVHTEKQSTIN
ncbi:MAG: IS200/IS605 family transposase [Alkalibacterium sp.]|nr:IS200/IS605 family transposase [Alkalibacterium sp.]